MNGSLFVSGEFWLLIGIAVGAAIVVSALCLQLAKSMLRWGWISGKAETEARGQGGTILAITIGLCVVSIWTGHQDCQHSQVGMAEALIKTYRSCSALPAPSRQIIANQFIRFIKETDHLDDSLQGVGLQNRFWEPLHQARLEAIRASATLSEERQIWIESRFDNLLEERFSWALSFFYGLHPLLWVVLAAAASLLLLVSAIEDTEGISTWVTMCIVAIPLGLVLAAAYALGQPMHGICRVNLDALNELIPLLQADLQ